MWATTHTHTSICVFPARHAHGLFTILRVQLRSTVTDKQCVPLCIRVGIPEFLSASFPGSAAYRFPPPSLAEKPWNAKLVEDRGTASHPVPCLMQFCSIGSGCGIHVSILPPLFLHFPSSSRQITTVQQHVPSSIQDQQNKTPFKIENCP